LDPASAAFGIVVSHPLGPGWIQRSFFIITLTMIND
jgi:hypothetical protein